MAFVVEPSRFVEGDESARADESLRKYYSNFVGRHFDSIALELDPYRFTERDFFAVSMLSVNVPPEAGMALLANETCEELLRQIPVDARIEDQSISLEPDSPVYQLWDLLRSLPGLGPTITSKLLSAKRPHLVPVHDTHVSRALLRGRLEGEWAAWRGALVSDELRATCAQLRRAAGVADYVSDLRTLDVCVWMRVHGDLRDGDIRFWELIDGA